MTKQEIFEVIEENFNILAAENDVTTKASQGRARKAAQAIKDRAALICQQRER